MLEFEPAREHLLTWYRLGGHEGSRAFQRFYVGWLRPAVWRVARRNGLEDAERDDLLQEVASHFFDRARQAGAAAESAAFWLKLIGWRLQDARRAAARGLRRPNADGSPAGAGPTKAPTPTPSVKPKAPPALDFDEHPDPAPNAEDALGELEEAESRRRIVREYLTDLSPVERLAHVCYSWPDLADLVPPSAFDELSARCGLTPVEVRATLDAAVRYKDDVAEWARRTLVVLASPGELATPEARAKALDTYRKARARAAARIAELSAAEAARKGRDR
ncbi:hypothetical protein L6V77_27120 [Myxococcota bacterium]|nr:hypothetical protein [Myxococcota bacterium]